jgi:hypothetical protein
MKKRTNKEMKILSDRAVLFIEKFAIPTLGITTKIDEDIATEILNFAIDCELSMVDDDGKDRTDEYTDKQRDILGDAYVTEVSAYLIDLEDLNRRLGFV